MKIISGKTGYEIIQVDKNGKNSSIIYCGANTMLDDKYIEPILDDFEMGDYVVLQNEMKNISHIIDCAYERGMKIVFIPSPYNEEIEKVDFRKLSWLIANEEEAKRITKNGNSSETIGILKETYPNMEIVITLGKRGCLYTCDNRVEKQRAYEVKTVNTIGIGDTFAGYFLAGIVSGKSNSEAVRQGALASALSATENGIAASIPYMHEVEQMALSLPERSEATSRKEETVVLVEKYIEENIKNVTLNELAKILNYSSAYTSRWIRQNMQISYNELVQKKRCALAAKLLQNTNMPIGEIIAYVGYNNESFFRSKFSSIYGKKPSQFREQNKKIDDVE